MSKFNYIFIVLILMVSSELLGQWTQNRFTSTEDKLLSVHFSSINSGWLAGSNHHTAILYGTSDGGNTWVKIFFPNTFELESIFFINEEIGWAVGNNGVILITTDGGRSWFYLDSGTSKNLSKVFFVTQYNGWICNESNESNPSKEQFGSILNTTNGGVDWIVQKEVSNFRFSDIFFINETDGWATGSNYYSQSIVFKTTNGGNNWESIPIETVKNIFHKIYFLNDKVGWIVGNNGEILKSTDGGNNWVSRNQNHTTENLYSCFFQNTQRGFIVGENGTILFTTNGGEGWTKQQNITENNLSFIFFSDEYNGWIVGDGGTCLSTQNGGITFVEEERELLNEYKLFQNYPNPFNPSTTISYKIPNRSHVTIKIFDAAGCEIKTLVDEVKVAGLHMIKFNNKNLPSGIYYYRLTTLNYSETRKMIILK